MRIVLVSLASVAVAACGSGDFQDRMATINPTTWFVADGWSNGPSFLNDWRRSQIHADSSGMTVILDKNPVARGGYSSGEIQSNNAYRFGYYEAKMTAARASGVDTGFFTYTKPSGGNAWNEIDVEILGRNPRAVQFTYHVGDQQRATTVPVSFDASAESHSYGFDWQPGYINWYIDGKLAHTETGQSLPLPSEPQQILFDVWNSNSLPGWMGSFVWPGHPIKAHVQCIARSDHFSGARLCK